MGLKPPLRNLFYSIRRASPSTQLPLAILLFPGAVWYVYIGALTITLRQAGAFMNVVTRLFLRAKHWQIFLLIFGMFFVGMIAGSMKILTSGELSPEGVFRRVAILDGILTVLFLLCFLGWFWSMGTFLVSIVDPAFRLRRGFFRFGVIYVLLYMPLFLAIFDSLAFHPVLFGIIFPLHFFAVFCMFYLLYFVSKSLVLAESGKQVSFYDYSGPFFLLWFFPIGIWIVQPRINRLYERHINANPNGTSF